MKVRNSKGTTRFDKPAGCSSWLNYWEQSKMEIKRFIKRKCPACGQFYFGISFVGAHVQKAPCKDRSMYIVPLCRACNNRTDVFDINSQLMLPVPSGR